MTLCKSGDNLFRDLYTHSLWQSFDQISIMNLLVVLCGKEYHIKEDINWVCVSSFWKFNRDTRMYTANKQWNMIGDD